MAAIVVLALIPRAIYLFQIQSWPFFDHPILDSHAQHRWATMLLNTWGLGNDAVTAKAPLYSYYLALHHFRHRRHEVILVHVLDKAEIEFPFRDVIAFTDLETDERIQVDPAYVRDAYLEQIEAFIEDYRRACAEAQIDYVITDTSVPYDFMLSRYIAKRNMP